jgi:hypothetical protein
MISKATLMTAGHAPAHSLSKSSTPYGVEVASVRTAPRPYMELTVEASQLLLV